MPNQIDINEKKIQIEKIRLANKSQNRQKIINIDRKLETLIKKTINMESKIAQIEKQHRQKIAQIEK